MTAMVSAMPARRAHSWIEWAMISQAVLAIYLQVVEWIPLGRWNNVANGNGQASQDVVLAILQLAIFIFYWRRWHWPMLAGIGLYVLWLYLEISSWWVPYFRGASPQFMKFYEHWFANTYKFLPAIDGHPIPDAEHTIILALLLTVLLCSVAATASAFRRPPSV
jgi:hypothetical protein